jgi:hypothetical protein
MNNNSVSLPDENLVVETVLEGDENDISRLLREQPSLSDFAADVKTIKEGLESLEEEEPPPFSLEKKTPKKAPHLFSSLQDLPLEWYKNPYILTFGFVLAVLFFYFCFILISKM